MNIANMRVMGRACMRMLPLPRRKTSLLERNLDAAYAWLCAAQDATPDGGVSGSYNMVRGWAGSYPETTGYIIPNFLHWADIQNHADARQRAIRMADWEVAVQLPEGAVRSGMLGVKVGPAVFNTGQVLFGWVSAYQATNDPAYAKAASRASSWLVSVQDVDGAWRRHLSMLTTSNVQTYNVRAAWGLAMAGVELDERRWREAAIRNCDWALKQQAATGWFGCNTFSDNEQPLLHTIGYVLEGLLGTGSLLGQERYVNATIRGITPLMNIYRRTHTLYGRYDAGWNPTVRWRCLTGEAQVALVLERLSRLTGEASYSEISKQLLDGVARLQDVDSPYSESRGAVSGSWPLWGAYGPFNYMNWPAKFFMDALLLRCHNVDVQTAPTRPYKEARLAPQAAQ
jgi:hypothetical protein